MPALVLEPNSSHAEEIQQKQSEFQSAFEQSLRGDANGHVLDDQTYIVADGWADDNPYGTNYQIEQFRAFTAG